MEQQHLLRRMSEPTDKSILEEVALQAGEILEDHGGRLVSRDLLIHLGTSLPQLSPEEHLNGIQYGVDQGLIEIAHQNGITVYGLKQ